jgi:hypothetical protein
VGHGERLGHFLCRFDHHPAQGSEVDRLLGESALAFHEGAFCAPLRVASGTYLRSAAHAASSTASVLTRWTVGGVEMMGQLSMPVEVSTNRD